MVLAPEDQGHVLVTINITKAPVFAITITINHDVDVDGDGDQDMTMILRG